MFRANVTPSPSLKVRLCPSTSTVTDARLVVFTPTTLTI
jgi:hypothetical protein